MAERELNDELVRHCIRLVGCLTLAFYSRGYTYRHEVRNPLVAAMSACSFVSSAVNESEPLSTQESQESVRDDVGVIRSSLVFINDLLRSMLDMQ